VGGVGRRRCPGAGRTRVAITIGIVRTRLAVAGRLALIGRVRLVRRFDATAVMMVMMAAADLLMRILQRRCS
jgi:hypothetical protein